MPYLSIFLFGKCKLSMALNIIRNTGPPKNSKYGPTDTKSGSSVIPARGIATNNNLNHRPARSRARNILILIFFAGILVGRWFRWQLIVTIITLWWNLDFLLIKIIREKYSGNSRNIAVVWWVPSTFGARWGCKYYF